MTKRFLVFLTAALCMILSCTFITGCGEKNDTKEEDNEEQITIIGSWAADGMPDAIYTFNEDGTGNYTFYETVMKFTYTDDGTAVTLKYENADNENVFKYTIEGKKLTIEDSFGEKVIYNKK